MPAVIQSRTLSLEAARRAVERAVTESHTRDCVTCIAVVDRHGHLLSYDRMDGAPLLSGPLAQDKAYTVSVNGMATHEWWEMIEDKPMLVHGVNKIDRLIIFGGGVPVMHRDELLGAVGVSGHSTMEQDRDIAEAAVEAALELIENES